METFVFLVWMPNVVGGVGGSLSVALAAEGNVLPVVTPPVVVVVLIPVAAGLGWEEEETGIASFLGFCFITGYCLPYSR